MTAAYFYDHRRRRVVVVLSFDAWAVRNLRAKGFLSIEHILTRPMTAIEIEAEAPRTRLHYLIYATWAGFFEDELAVGVPPAIVAQLRAFARNYPLANSVNQPCASDDRGVYDPIGENYG
jgi:hypothetical protein